MRYKLFAIVLITFLVPAECFGFSALTDCDGMIKLANHTLRVQATYTCLAAFVGLLMALLYYRAHSGRMMTNSRKAIFICLASLIFIFFIRAGLDIYYYSSIKPKILLFGGKEDAMGVQGFFSNQDKEWRCGPKESMGDSYEAVLEKWM